MGDYLLRFLAVLAFIGLCFSVTVLAFALFYLLCTVKSLVTHLLHHLRLHVLILSFLHRTFQRRKGDTMEEAYKYCPNPTCSTYERIEQTSREVCASCGGYLAEPAVEDLIDAQVSERYLSLMRNTKTYFTRPQALLLIEWEDVKGIRFHAHKPGNTPAPSSPISTPPPEVARLEWMRWMVSTKRVSDYYPEE